MKTRIFWVLMLLTMGMYGQEITLTPADKQQIKQQLNAYFTAVSNKDWNTVLDKMPPELFRLNKREEILKIFENAENDYQSYETHQPTNLRIFDQAYRKDGKRYALVGYTNNVTWIFRPKPKETQGSFQGRMDYTLFQLQKQFGRENVTAGTRTGMIHIRIPKYLLVITDEKSGRTYLIDFPKDMRRQTDLQTIVDPEVIAFFNNIIFHHT